VPAVLPPTSNRLSVTAGVSASSDHMSRALGSESSWLWSKFVCTRLAVVSIVVDSPTTVTASCIAWRDREASAVAVKPTPTRTSSRTTLPKPCMSKVSL
jgi:hypothetical protein